VRFVLGCIAWIGWVHAVPDGSMVGLFNRAVSDWLFSALLIWLLYLALEPSVRARWPHSIVTWNRIMAGRWLDPQVGSHIMIGASVGCCLFGLFVLPDLLSGRHRNAMGAPSSLFYLEGTRQWIGGHAGRMAQALIVGLSFFFGLFFLRTLLKRDWLAAIAASLIGIWIEGDLIGSSDWQLKVAIYLVVYFVLFIVMLRFGLVSTISAVFFLNTLGAMDLGLDWSTWYAPYGLATLVLLLSIAISAFWRSLGSRSLFVNGAAERA
jgi:serine/threonine-protein kinase